MFLYTRKISVNELNKELETISSELQKAAFPKGFLQCVLYIIFELSSNVQEHSSAKSARINIEQKNKVFAIEVVDDGIGLRQSYLNKQVFSKDDQSAIELALSGLSTKDFKERGFGLYSVRRMTVALAGRFYLSSGVSRAEIKNNSIAFKKVDRKVKGVGVKVELRIKPIDFYKYIE